MLAHYKDHDLKKDLGHRFALEILVGDYESAVGTIEALRKIKRPDNPLRAAWVNTQYEIYARAKGREASEKVPFDRAYQQAFRDVMGRLDDRTAALVVREVALVDESWIAPVIQVDLNKQKGKNTITCRTRRTWRATTRAGRRIATPDRSPLRSSRRTTHGAMSSNRDIHLRTPDGGTLCAMVMRPRGAPALPALLTFTIYVDPKFNLNDVRQTASNGYVGVEGYPRGKACSPDQPVPFIHDGIDASSLIDWISHQSWSDNRVGMYGGSYDGFSHWAAAKHMPKALKALMPSRRRPAIDVPMEGNVFWNFVYPWTF